MSTFRPPGRCDLVPDAAARRRGGCVPVHQALLSVEAPPFRAGRNAPPARHVVLIVWCGVHTVGPSSGAYRRSAGT